MSLGIHKDIAWQTNNPFLRTAARRIRKAGYRSISDVLPNDGKITIVQFPNVRTFAATHTQQVIFLWSETNSAAKCDR